MKERTLKFVLAPLDKPRARASLYARHYLTGFTPLDNSKVQANPVRKSIGFSPNNENSDSRAYLTGFTLIEMIVVVAIVALLAVFGMPAVRTLLNSFHSEGNTRAMINSALSCARSIAVKNHTPQVSVSSMRIIPVTAMIFWQCRNI